MIGLTDTQQLIFACVGLMATVIGLGEYWHWRHSDPPLRHDTKRLKKELARHKENDECS